MSSCLAMPCIGHLERTLHIFGYLKLHPKKTICSDPVHPAINENRFQDCDWADFYRDSSEEIPGNKPVSRGNCISAHNFFMQTILGTLRLDGIILASCCSVTRRQYMVHEEADIGRNIYI